MNKEIPIVLIFVSVWFFANTPPVFSDVFLPPNDPEVPWEGDPDISALKDERIKHLWEEIVKNWRRKHPRGSSASAMTLNSSYKTTGISLDDQEYLIDTLERELHAGSIDWDCVYTVLILMNAGMNANPKIPELARYLVKLPRPIKMSDERGDSYQQILFLLQSQNSHEAAAVLADALTREFWGDYPMNSRKLNKRYTEKSILSLRSIALTILLHNMSPEIVFPYLRNIAERYSVPPDCDVDAENQFICSIHEAFAFASERQAKAAEKKPDDSAQEE